MLKLPPLPYAYEALEPTISAETMRTHHDKHHARYLETVNACIAELDLEDQTLEQIVVEAERQGFKKLLNNAGQAWNHAIFWDGMTPARRDPQGELMDAIEVRFGHLAALKEEFVEKGADHFASGWVWLVAEGSGLSVVTTHDGGTLANKRLTPLLVCDLWEHAYYLDYRQDREPFLDRWFDNLANWAFAEDQFAAARGRHAPWQFDMAA
jgi:Fe-Mn family superoxide dismutase